MDSMGGVDRTVGDVTYTRFGGVAFAGRYDTRFGGVDELTNEKGSSCTSTLAGVVKKALLCADTVFCEGMYLNTFGLNLSNALFLGDRQLVVSLWADPLTIYTRLNERSSGKRGDGYRNWETIFRKQRNAMIAAGKWKSIGVPVLQFNTAKSSVEDIRDAVIEMIRSLV